MTAVPSAVAALLVVPLTAAPARAVTGDGSSPFASYNMDGTNNGARWTSEVAPMARRNSLLALPEAAPLAHPSTTPRSFSPPGRAGYGQRLSPHGPAGAERQRTVRRRRRDTAAGAPSTSILT
ncbi:hypothetical protein [Streptomyces sp. NPDC059092]|uniref:hypothetical protein n=1 Tax=Streptomyces sp. NPDC059092 TaxID=3346725 RepID=UPI0036AB0CD1